MPPANPAQRFSSRVGNYIRYRPGYPAGLLALLQTECGLRPASVVADIGSGTGLLSKLFLDHGNPVFGVEPNPGMRQAGASLLGGYANFTSIEGSAEQTHLPPLCADFVTAGQAAHWFDLARARREFVRILRPRGWTVLVWNERKTGSTPFLVEYEKLLLTYGTDYEQVRHERTTAGIGSFFSPAACHAAVFPYRQDFDYPSLEGRVLSSSYTPLPAHPNHAPMLAELRRIFDRHHDGGQVAFEYETRVFYGRLT